MSDTVKDYSVIPSCSGEETGDTGYESIIRRTLHFICALLVEENVFMTEAASLVYPSKSPKLRSFHFQSPVALRLHAMIRKKRVEWIFDNSSPPSDALSIAGEIRRHWALLADPSLSCEVESNGFLSFSVVTKSAPVVVSNSEENLVELDLTVVGVVARATYQHKWGTPRQGSFAPGSSALLCVSRTSVEGEGLQEGDSVIVVWGCHMNSSSFNPLKAKMRPPKAGGLRVGVLACRSPYRPSPIGMSVCKVVRIGPPESADLMSCLSSSDLLLEISGSDMLEGTPVLKLQRLGPHLRVPALRVPSYVSQAAEKPTPVYWGGGAFLQGQPGGVGEGGSGLTRPDVNLINETLRQDPRSLHSHKKHGKGLYAIDVKLPSSATVSVVYVSVSAVRAAQEGGDAQGYIQVVKLLPPPSSSEPRVRTKAWMEDLLRFLTFLEFEECSG